MWYQAASHLDNALSPRKTKELNPNSHAHSPRRDSVHRHPKLSSPSADRSISRNRAQDNSIRNVLAGRIMGEDSTQQPASAHDPFIGDPTLSPSLQWQHSFQKSNLGRGDITMLHRGSLSSEDLSMPNNSRFSPPSNTDRVQMLAQPSQPSSSHGVQMTDYSRPHSLTRARSHVMPDTSRPPSVFSRASSRKISAWEQALSGVGPLPQTRAQEVEAALYETTGDRSNTTKMHPAQRATGTKIQSSDCFGEDVGISSPQWNGIVEANAPIDITVSPLPAMNLYPVAKDGGDLIDSGRPRVVSSTTRELPLSATLVSSGGGTEPHPISRKSTPNEFESKDLTSETHAVIRKMPSSNVKSRKEGRTSDIGLALPSNEANQRFPTSTSDPNKENIQSNNETHTPRSGKKRRRISETVESDMLLKTRTESGKRLSLKICNAEMKGSSPPKHNDMDDLTSEGIVTRLPLDHLEENVI